MLCVVQLPASLAAWSVPPIWRGSESSASTSRRSVAPAPIARMAAKEGWKGRMIAPAQWPQLPGRRSTVSGGAGVPRQQHTRSDRVQTAGSGEGTSDSSRYGLPGRAAAASRAPMPLAPRPSRRKVSEHGNPAKDDHPCAVRSVVAVHGGVLRRSGAHGVDLSGKSKFEAAGVCRSR